MRVFYSDEGAPVWDGNLISKSARNDFVNLGWVARCEGYNIITALGSSVMRKHAVAVSLMVFKRSCRAETLRRVA